jgi:hypothetical protein
MLDDIEVLAENTPVPNQQVMTIGSCSFRFEYLKNSTSPLQEANTPVTPKNPKKVISKVGVRFVVYAELAKTFWEQSMPHLVQFTLCRVQEHLSNLKRRTA